MIYAFDDASLHWTHRHDYPQQPLALPLPQQSYDYVALDGKGERSDINTDTAAAADRENKKPESQQPFLWRNSLEHGAQQYPITDADIMDTTLILSPQEVSPLGSDLGSLPLPEMSPRHHQSHSQQSQSQEPPLVVDSLLVTQLWRQLIEDSSLFNFNSFTSNHHHQQHEGVEVGLGLDAEPTPPLDLEISPVVHFAPEPSAGHYADGNKNNTISTLTSPTASITTVELVAPKPRRLVNPAIHLAALVEEEDDTTTHSIRTADEDVRERDREIVVVVPEEEETLQEEVLGMYSNGHSFEELREYMSDSEHSSSGEMVIDDDQEESGFDTIPSLVLPTSSEPSSDAFSLDGWSFPHHHREEEGYYYPAASYQAQEVAPLPPSSSSSCGPSPLHTTITPQYNNTYRPSQLREAVRERRAARQVMHTHSRHASLPDVQYRPAKWNLNLNLPVSAPAPAPIIIMPAEPAPVHHYLPQQQQQQQQHARTAVLAPHRRRERDASRSVDWSALASQNMILVPPPDDYTYHTAPQYHAAVPLYGMHHPYGGH